MATRYGFGYTDHRAVYSVESDMIRLPNGEKISAQEFRDMSEEAREQLLKDAMEVKRRQVERERQIKEMATSPPPRESDDDGFMRELKRLERGRMNAYANKLASEAGTGRKRPFGNDDPYAPSEPTYDWQSVADYLKSDEMKAAKAKVEAPPEPEEVKPLEMPKLKLPELDL